MLGKELNIGDKFFFSKGQNGMGHTMHEYMGTEIRDEGIFYKCKIKHRKEDRYDTYLFGGFFLELKVELVEKIMEKLRLKDLEDGTEFWFYPLKNENQKDFPNTDINKKVRGRIKSKNGVWLIAQLSDNSVWRWYNPTEEGLNCTDFEAIK